MVILTEKLEERVLRASIFREYVEELEKTEVELSEYYELSMLAIALKDKEAYDGLQQMMSEKYWPLFFRKILFTTSLYFLLLTPYMIASHYILGGIIPNAASIVLFIAIAFFTFRLGYELIKDMVYSWKAAKEAYKELEKCK